MIQTLNSPEGKTMGFFSHDRFNIGFGHIGKTGGLIGYGVFGEQGGIGRGSWQDKGQVTKVNVDIDREGDSFTVTVTPVSSLSLAPFSGTFAATVIPSQV